MKGIYEKKLVKIQLAKGERAVVRMVFRILRKKMVRGHDDFYHYLCIPIKDFNELYKKFEQK